MVFNFYHKNNFSFTHSLLPLFKLAVMDLPKRKTKYLIALTKEESIFCEDSSDPRRRAGGTTGPVLGPESRVTHQSGPHMAL